MNGLKKIVNELGVPRVVGFSAVALGSLGVGFYVGVSNSESLGELVGSGVVLSSVLGASLAQYESMNPSDGKGFAPAVVGGIVSGGASGALVTGGYVMGKVVNYFS